MSQSDFGNLSSPLSGTALINTYLEPWRDALHSCHKGNSRPSYAVAGTIWINDTTTPWILNCYEGADDISLGTINPSTNLFTPANAAPTASLDMPQNFRLTLTTGVPVTTADVTGATTIYCTPYKGNRIALYDGSTWNIRSSAQFSLALGTLTSGKPYDVFCYDNAGTPTLEFLVWTNDTTRATALAYQDGVLVKSGATTRRYLGTFYTTATTTTEDSQAKRYLYNYYHRVSKDMLRLESTASWTYTTAVVRQANASTSNQLNFLIGVAEDAVIAQLKVAAENTTVGVEITSGISLDSTSTIASGANSEDLIKVANSRSTFNSNYVGIPAAGRHFLSWNEYSVATGTTTWYGSAGRAALRGVVLV